jgi:hypothetical protein
LLQACCEHILLTSCEWQPCSNLIKWQHCYNLLTSLLQACCEHILLTSCEFFTCVVQTQTKAAYMKFWHCNKIDPHPLRIMKYQRVKFQLTIYFSTLFISLFHLMPMFLRAGSSVAWPRLNGWSQSATWFTIILWSRLSARSSAIFHTLTTRDTAFSVTTKCTVVTVDWNTEWTNLISTMYWQYDKVGLV